MNPVKTPRERCYHAIRNSMGEDMMRYYSTRKTLLGDERSRAAQAASHEGLMNILRILDQFEISDITDLSARSVDQPNE